MAYRFHHCHIKAKDPRKSARWWADNFGAKILPERDAGGGSLFAPIEISGVVINISSPGPGDAAKHGEGDLSVHYGLEHFGLQTENLDADLARLRKQGMEIFEVKDAGAFKIAFVETPDKVRIELLQPSK